MAQNEYLVQLYRCLTQKSFKIKFTFWIYTLHSNKIKEKRLIIIRNDKFSI